MCLHVGDMRKLRVLVNRFYESVCIQTKCWPRTGSLFCGWAITHAYSAHLLSLFHLHAVRPPLASPGLVVSRFYFDRHLVDHKTVARYIPHIAGNLKLVSI